MIYRYFADSHLIESTIVHIFDDDIASLDTRYDTYMSIVSIVSRSRELDYSTNYRGRSGFYSFGSCIPHPWGSIPSPCDTLVLSHIPGTIPSDKSAWFARIFDCISLLEPCFWWYSDWRFLFDLCITRIPCLCGSLGEWCFGWLWYIFVEYSNRSRYCTRNHQIHTDTDTRSISETIDRDNISSIYAIFRGYCRDSISIDYGMHHSWDRRDLENLSDLELIATLEIIGPQDRICTHPILIWYTSHTLESSDGMFFDIFIHDLCSYSCSWGNSRTLSRVPTSDADESSIWDIAIIRDITEITICRDDRRLIVVSGTDHSSRSEERERWI
jgi:hypothetical protein